MARIPLASAGYATVEALPVFHCCSGGSALRVAVAPVHVTPLACEWCGLPGELASQRDALVWGYVDCEDVAKLAVHWSVDLVVLDGVEPLSNAEPDVLDCLRERLPESVALGARWQGTPPRPPSRLDLVLVDYAPAGFRDARNAVEVLGLAEDAARGRLGAHVEVYVYLQRPILEQLRPVLDRLEGSSVPLHVFVEEYFGGGGVARLYREARRRVPFTYVHAGPYSELDTWCPRCGAGLSVRYPGYLDVLAFEKGACPKCGTPIPLRRLVSTKTPARLARITRGETVWHPPGSLPVKVDFSYSRGPT